MTRGDVILVYIPYVDGPGGKKRPAVVLQGDEFNARLPHTIVAAISTNLRGVGSPAHYLIDPGDSEGKAAGVLHKSVVRCDRLFTVEQNPITERSESWHPVLCPASRILSEPRSAYRLKPFRALVTTKNGSVIGSWRGGSQRFSPCSHTKE